MTLLPKPIEFRFERKAQVGSELSERFSQFLKFCVVGGSGFVVDMTILALLADPKFLGLNVTLSKLCAAEIAMTNNFIWNELWTFRTPSLDSTGGEGRDVVATENDGGRSPLVLRTGVGSGVRGNIFRRFLLFNAICGIGIGLAVLLLHLFHTWLGWNLYLSNLLAIVIVTLWNFGMNARFNWSRKRHS